MPARMTETVAETLDRVLASLHPGDAESVEGVRFLAAVAHACAVPHPLAARAGEQTVAKLLAALAEYDTPRSVPSLGWLEARLGLLAFEVEKHWPFLRSVVLPSYERFVRGQADPALDESEHRERAAVQLVTQPGRAGEQFALAVASEIVDRDRAIAALDETRARRERKADSPNAKRRPKSEFYVPSGDVARAIGYARTTLMHVLKDASSSARDPHFLPPTLRRLRRQLQRQEKGLEPRDPELFALLEEYFGSRAAKPTALAHQDPVQEVLREGLGDGHDIDGDTIDLVTRRDELAGLIRTVLDRRERHGHAGRVALSDLAKRLGAGSDAEIRKVKEQLRRVVQKLRAQGQLPPRSAEGTDTFGAREAATIVAAFRRRSRR